MANIAMSVADKAILSNRATAIKARLEAAGHSVTLYDDDTVDWIPTDFDLVVIDESVNSGSVAWITALAVPIWTDESFVFDDIGFCASIIDRNNVTDIDIVNNSHFITSVFNTGALTVVNSPLTLQGGETWSNNTMALAVSLGFVTTCHLFAIEKGATLSDASIAEERRVGFFRPVTTDDVYTADGWTLFDRSIEWLLYQDLPVGTTYQLVIDSNIPGIPFTIEKIA